MGFRAKDEVIYSRVNTRTKMELERQMVASGYKNSADLLDYLLRVKGNTISYKKLRKLIDEHPDTEFILWNGSRPQIKRRLFEKYVDEYLTAI